MLTSVKLTECRMDEEVVTGRVVSGTGEGEGKKGSTEWVRDCTKSGDPRSRLHLNKRRWKSSSQGISLKENKCSVALLLQCVEL